MIKRLNAQSDELHHYGSDCMKCGGRVIVNMSETKSFPCECAYPEDCPTKKLEASNNKIRIDPVENKTRD